MDSSSSPINGHPTQPPKKRRSGTDFEEGDIKPDINSLNTRLGASTPPESGNSQSQDSPLDFSVKNGSDSVTPPSPPSTTSPPSARSSPSIMSPPIATSPLSNHFPSPNLEMTRKDTTVRMPFSARDSSDPCSRPVQENMNMPRTKLSIVSPTMHMHMHDTEEDTNGSKEIPVANSPFARPIHSPQNSYDRPVNTRNYENGFGSCSKEYDSHVRNRESVANDYLHRPSSSDGPSSTNMTTLNPYMGMLPATFGTGLMSGQGGILTAQGGLLNGQPGLLNGQGLLNGHAGLLNGQGMFLNGQTGLLNSQTFKYGAADTNGDRKPSKSARPFKIYEHEILNYPYPYIQNPNRYPEMPQHIYNPTENSRNESPKHSNSDSRLSNNGEPQREVSDEFSDESQHSNNPNQGFDSNGSRRKGEKYPDEKKDAAYYEKRRKNNLAAKRSRDARRLKEDAIATRARNLVQENTALKMRLAEFQVINMRLETELNGFKRAAYDQRSEIDKLKDEVARLNRGFAYSNVSRNCDRSGSPSL